MLEWLTFFLPNRKASRLEHPLNDGFLRRVKELAWVKTHHHGWQFPTSVFFSIDYFHDRFTAHDLPFLDVPAYSHLNLTDSETKLVFDELRLMTDVRKGKGRAAIVKYFSKCSAKKLDLEAASKFYPYLDDFASWDQICALKIWNPAGATSKVPSWIECIISNELGIFADSSNVTMVDKIYDASLLPFFDDLQVPEKASGAMYCKIWLEWSRVTTASKKGKEEDGYPQNASLVARIKVQHVLKDILHNWQNFSCEISRDFDRDSSSTDFSRNSRSIESNDECSEDIWESFHSRAWVPIVPLMVCKANETISIVPPSQVLIADDSELTKSFFKVTNGKLNIAWFPPGLSTEQRAKLVKMYLKIGVKKLSELITSDIRIPPEVWKKNVSRGKGVICEGLFRSVLAYLCKNQEKHGLSLEERQQILSPLTSATEVTVGEPLEGNFSLQVERRRLLPQRVKQCAFAHCDKVKRKLYCLRRDHALLKEDARKRIFNSQIVTTISTGILAEHPELVQGLIVLLLPLCESGFSKKSVDNEFQTRNLLIFPEDEKLLVESIATKIRD